MRLVAIRARDLPGVGDVELDHIPAGLVALVVPDGRMRRALHQLLAAPGGEGVERVTSPAGADPALAALPAGLVSSLHTGLELDDLGAIAAAGALAPALLAGLARVEAARDRLARVRGESMGGGGPPEALLARIRSLEGVPDELRRLEEELRRLRGADVELAGDLEHATMQWLRERQDAETRLQAYRDRARELRETLRTMDEGSVDAPCPTCGRPLLDHHERVRGALADEWEGLVHDGGWWRRRREQLEYKPDTLQETERRLLELQAEGRALEERVRLARGRREELEEAMATLAAHLESGRAPGRGAVSEAVARAADDALAEAARHLGEASRRRLLDRGAAYLLHLTQGRLLGFRESPARGVVLVGPEADLPHPPDDDAAAGKLALRLAAVTLLHEAAGGVEPSIIVGDAFDRLDDAVKVRAVGLLTDLRAGGRLAQILLVTRGEVIDRTPERFDAVLELRVEGGAVVFRALGGGPARIRLVGS